MSFKHTEHTHMHAHRVTSCFLQSPHTVSAPSGHGIMLGFGRGLQLCCMRALCFCICQGCLQRRLQALQLVLLRTPFLLRLKQ